jgi:hypothetical protein
VTRVRKGFRTPEDDLQRIPGAFAPDIYDLLTLPRGGSRKDHRRVRPRVLNTRHPEEIANGLSLIVSREDWIPSARRWR